MEREQARTAPIPTGVVGSYATYETARHAVDHLAARGLTVEDVAIVPGDLRFVEQVTGRRGYGGAMADGATAGAATGALLGFFLGLFSLVAPLASGIVLAFWGLIIGAVIGALVGLALHALAGDRRGFESVRRLDAGRYDVVAPGAAAERARALLEERHVRPAA